MERFIRVCQACRHQSERACDVCGGRQVLDLIPATEVTTGEPVYLEVVPAAPAPWARRVARF